MVSGRNCFPSSSGRLFDNRNANSISEADGLGFSNGKPTNNELHLGISAKRVAILLLPIALAACAGSDDDRSVTYTDDRGVANQPYPNNYRAELLAFMKTYLNNPVGVHDAAMAEPAIMK